MAFILHAEGGIYEAQAAYSEEQTPPENFYVGLCNDTLVRADALTDIAGEPSGSGYARQAVPSTAVGCVVSDDGTYTKTTFTEETFTASGGSWGSLNTWFLATSIDGGGKLIASGPIDPARVIGDGDSIAVTAYIRRSTA